MKPEINKLRKRIDSQLAIYLTFKNERPKVIYNAMRYSVFAGGKRLRPLLFLFSAKACGLSYSDAMPHSCALEMIHTYSLIHDDLPAMDDDDMRRGKPSLHKKYGEANAILAGDALLTRAFEVSFIASKRKNVKPASCLAASAEIARAAGISGMVGGQAADIYNEGRKASKNALDFIHTRKTGALIAASVSAGALLAGAGRKKTALMRMFGEKIGLAFQITDDILDVTGGDKKKIGKKTGKDASTDKLTYPAVYGLETAGKKARKLILEAKQILCKIGRNAGPLMWMAEYVAGRKY